MEVIIMKVIFETLEEVEEVLRELIEIKKGIEKENLKKEGK